MITCPNCNHQNDFGSSFCENCGHDFREIIPPPPTVNVGTGTACSSCGQPNIPGAAFCENCGVKLGLVALPKAPDPVPSPSQVPQAVVQLNCSNCGRENVQGSVFCENCGSQLSQEVPESAEVHPQDAVVEVPPVPPSSAETLCNQCGFSNPAGNIFCGNCGNQMSQASVPSEFIPQPGGFSPEPLQIKQLTGRLVLPVSGVFIEFPTGVMEVIIGREDPISGVFPDIDLEPHGGHDGGVGRRHARLFIQGSQVMIEDLDSVNGTMVNKKKLLPNQPQPLMDGAELRFGKITAIYHAR